MSEAKVEVILRDVRDHLDAEAVVAGGWARDILLSKEPKDVDVWFHPTGKTVEEVNTLLQEIWPDALQRRPVLVATPGSPAAEWSVAIWSLNIHGMDVDLIWYHERISPFGRNVVEQFDFGICQAVYMGMGDYYGTDAFHMDAWNATITFNPAARDRYDLTRVVHDHLPRLQAKFPDYTPVNIPIVVMDKSIAIDPVASRRSIGFTSMITSVGFTELP